MDGLQKMTKTKVHPHFHIPYDLVIQDGIVVRGPRAVIPAHLHKKSRDKLHVTHTESQSCLCSLCLVTVVVESVNKTKA